MGCEPVDYTNVFQNLVDAIGNISISQTVNVSGGGCCGDTIPDDSTLPADIDVTVIDPEGDPPDGFDTWEEYQAAKCRDTDWLITQVINGSAALNGGYLALVSSLTFGLGSALFVAAFPPAVTVVLPALVIAAIVTAILTAVGTGSYNRFDDISTQLELDRQDRFCDIIEWNSASDLRTKLLLAIQTAGLDAGADPEDIEPHMDIFRLIYGGDYLNSFVDNIGNNAPAEYVQVADCDCWPGEITFNFDDGTSQGWVFENNILPSPPNQPCSGSVTTGGITGHCLRVDHPASSGNRGGEWVLYDPAPGHVVQSGDYFQAYIANHSGSTDSGIRIKFKDGTYSTRQQLVNSSTSFTIIVLYLAPYAGKEIEFLQLSSDVGSGNPAAGYWLWDNVTIKVSG